jgi:glucose/arabinose dehydrogenase
MRKAIIAAAGGIAAVAIVISVFLAQGSSPLPPAVNDGIGVNDGITTGTQDGDPFTAISDSNLPAVTDPALKVEKVVQGLRSPTSMAFVGSDMLITEKDGNLRLVNAGELAQAPALSFDVDSFNERGLLGVAYDDDKVFLYMTETSGTDTKNRVYRYDLQAGSLANKQVILELPGTPGPNHDGGKIIAHDGHLYVVIGDLNRDGKLQNYPEGPEPDDTSVILKVDYEGQPAANVLASYPAYYAYGIRNGFGLDFDPVSGTLWMTENGPDRYDEVNIVQPGFNSGWERIMGPASRSSEGEDSLTVLVGSHYADPEFSWERSRGVTDIEFLDSDALGDYANSVFVGDINGGNLYYFVVNEGRDGFVLEGGLSDLVGGDDELADVTLGTGFGGITDIETGPGGYLYVLSFNGNLYRLVPAE